jgi:hypothetical protein
MVEFIQHYVNSKYYLKYFIFKIKKNEIFYFSGKEKVLGVTPQRFDAAAREIMVGLKSGRSPILLPSLQLHITRFLRA